MKSINRRQFVNRMSLSAAAAIAFSKFGYSTPGYFAYQNSAIDYVDIEITQGKIRGIRTEGVNIFKGIPYAGRVSGDRRFRRPAPLEPWTGVRDALQLGAPAMQSGGRGTPAPAEDCLFLNVWTPANDNKKRPVMFYNHGGGYVSGSGGSGGQDGANLAQNFDVVVVETNHRLGLFGFLYLDEIAGSDYTGSGNMGILDITAGLKWVQENIAEFGGDPNNVMIFGESGGGGKTSCLYAMPEAAPYFSKASIESGPGVRMLTRENAAETTARVLKELNIDPKDWRKLLDVPAADLLTIQSKFSPVAPHLEKNNTRGGFGPVVDGIVLPNHPFDPTAPEISRNKPLITGWNEDEYIFFIMQGGDTGVFKIDFEGLQTKLETQYGADTKRIIDTYRQSRPNASAPDIFIAVSSITMMGLGSVDIAEKKVKQNGAPVYLYNFGYKVETKIPGTDYAMGTPHALDISFKFNNVVPPKEGSQPRMSMAGNRPERFAASHNFAELWATFARTSKPAAEGVPEWPAYNLKDRPSMRIDSKCEVINNRFSEELNMWRSIGRL
jgi:para-nitrobenzyl esterase